MVLLVRGNENYYAYTFEIVSRVRSLRFCINKKRTLPLYLKEKKEIIDEKI